MTGQTIHVANLDDEAPIRTAISRLLETEGMVTHAYATSDELFDSIALIRPDCLLLDLQMREMSGLDVLKYLDERHICIPTIVITGSNLEDSRSICLKAGAIACLKKPFNAEQLIQTIKRVCVTPQPNSVSSFT